MVQGALTYRLCDMYTQFFAHAITPNLLCRQAFTFTALCPQDDPGQGLESQAKRQQLRDMGLSSVRWQDRVLQLADSSGCAMYCYRKSVYTMAPSLGMTGFYYFHSVHMPYMPSFGFYRHMYDRGNARLLFCSC